MFILRAVKWLAKELAIEAALEAVGLPVFVAKAVAFGTPALTFIGSLVAGLQEMPVWLAIMAAAASTLFVVAALWLLTKLILLLRRQSKPAAAIPPHSQETPMWKAVEYVGAYIGEVEGPKCFENARTAIRQAAQKGQVRVRGRKQIAGTYSQDDYSAIWTEIPPEYWEISEIGSFAASKFWENRDRHTNPEGASWGPLGFNEKRGYSALRVNWSEIVTVWPEKKP